MASKYSPVKTDSARINWHLSEICAAKGIRTVDLSAASGLCPTHISTLRNISEMPKQLNRDTLIKLCLALDITPDRLISIQLMGKPPKELSID